MTAAKIDELTANAPPADTPVIVTPNPELAGLAGDRPAFDALTLRDYFVAAALTGLLSGHDGETQLPDDAQVAKWAYGFADAMVQRRGAPEAAR